MFHIRSKGIEPLHIAAGHKIVAIITRSTTSIMSLHLQPEPRFLGLVREWSPTKQNQCKRSVKSGKWPSQNPQDLVRGKLSVNKTKTTDNAEKESRTIAISVNSIAESIWKLAEVGPCHNKIPVGTFIPPRWGLRSGGTDEQILLHLREVLMTKDPRGLSHDTHVDLKKKGANKCSPRKAMFDK
ncbi:uncharacterized protein N7506_009436 [Penicillium brevicompactum]|uniref:uncharacterized protein n=1 Tax=Penicillium brevicompactum TaxID=5074 RepID=UPI0025405D8E|nr:uncharacterized protein N7506_009436 [Penicillium brevicompactum]KAJ5326334.1 hypothetical protein N7506_009436 [Penicillium brevicompactum]